MAETMKVMTVNGPVEMILAEFELSEIGCGAHRPELVAWCPLYKAVVSANLAESSNKSRRMIEGGGVYVDTIRVVDPMFPLMEGQDYLIRVGSKNRKFVKIRVKGTE